MGKLSTLAQKGAGTLEKDLNLVAATTFYDYEQLQFVVSREGPMKKRGKLAKGWKQRYFVLCPPGCLFYFKDEQTSKRFQDLKIRNIKNKKFSRTGAEVWRQIADGAKELVLGSCPLTDLETPDVWKGPEEVRRLNSYKGEKHCMTIKIGHTDVHRRFYFAASHAKTLELWEEAINNVHNSSEDLLQDKRDRREARAAKRKEKAQKLRELEEEKEREENEKKEEQDEIKQRKLNLGKLLDQCRKEVALAKQSVGDDKDPSTLQPAVDVIRELLKQHTSALSETAEGTLFCKEEELWCRQREESLENLDQEYDFERCKAKMDRAKRSLENALKCERINEIAEYADVIRSVLSKWDTNLKENQEGSDYIDSMETYLGDVEIVYDFLKLDDDAKTFVSAAQRQLDNVETHITSKSPEEAKEAWQDVEELVEPLFDDRFRNVKVVDEFFDEYEQIKEMLELALSDNPPDIEIKSAEHDDDLQARHKISILKVASVMEEIEDMKEKLETAVEDKNKENIAHYTDMIIQCMGDNDDILSNQYIADMEEYMEDADRRGAAVFIADVLKSIEVVRTGMSLLQNHLEAGSTIQKIRDSWDNVQASAEGIIEDDKFHDFEPVSKFLEEYHDLELDVEDKLIIAEIDESVQQLDLTYAALQETIENQQPEKTEEYASKLKSGLESFEQTFGQHKHAAPQIEKYTMLLTELISRLHLKPQETPPPQESKSPETPAENDTDKPEAAESKTSPEPEQEETKDEPKEPEEDPISQGHDPEKWATMAPGIRDEYIKKFDVECIKLSQPFESLKSKIESKEYEKTANVEIILRKTLKPFVRKYRHYDQAQMLIKQCEDILLNYDSDIRVIAEEHTMKKAIADAKQKMQPLNASITLKHVEKCVYYRDKLNESCQIIRDIVERDGGGAADGKKFIKQVDKVLFKLKHQLSSEIAQEDIYNLSKQVKHSITDVLRALSDENVDAARKAKRQLEQHMKPLQEYRSSTKAMKVLSQGNEVLASFDSDVRDILG